MRQLTLLALALSAACASSPGPMPARSGADASHAGPSAQPATHDAAPVQQAALPPAPQPAATEAASAPQAPAIDLPNARKPLPGVLTGGAPSEQTLREARAAGYKTVISLLPQAESGNEAAQAEQLGLRFVSIPIAGPTDLTEDNARRLAAAMGGEDTKPLILHCKSGNRAGALLALKAYYVDGDTAQQALALGERAGLESLKPAVAAQMQAKPATR